MSTTEVEEIISRTISELQKQEGAVQFKKPKTMQGWIYILLGCASIIAFLWTSVVFLNDIASHQKIAHHQGTKDLFETMHNKHESHATSEELHRREEHLELQIIQQVQPLKQDLSIIQTNQANFRQDIRDVREDSREIQQAINKLSEQIGQKANK